MSISLKVTPAILKTKAAEIQTDIRAMENEYKSIQDIISRTTGYWIGVAGDKARREFDSQKEEMQNVLRRLKEHPVDLLIMAGVYEQTERNVLAQNQSLATDVII